MTLFGFSRKCSKLEILWAERLIWNICFGFLEKMLLELNLSEVLSFRFLSKVFKISLF